MKAYKGFNPDMTCLGFQYKEGETYTTDSASLCNIGFHACEAPLDVLGYYAPSDGNGNLNKFHEVELEDVSPEKDSDTKRCSKKITIGAELNLFGLSKAHVEWVKEQNDVKEESATGDRSAATNTGYWSAATNTGYWSAATNTGSRSAATNTGDRSAATNTGDRSAATNTGNWSAATNTGNWSAATNTGKNSIAVAWGIAAKSKAAKGSYIVLAEWKQNANGEWELVGAKMVKIDGKRYKPDKFYTLKNGKIVEAEE